MGKSPFFTVHCDLPREGPGEPDDVLWALDIAGTSQNAAICDAACGPGADTVTLAQARPTAQIDAVDLQAHFIDATKKRAEEFGSRITVFQQDFTKLPGGYDLIWCAGAAYFVGYLQALGFWRQSLLPGGAIAFSEPVYLGDTPSAEARAFWGPHIQPLSVPEMNHTLEQAGWRVHGHRVISGAPWAGYYDPMRARLEMLRKSDPDKALLDAIEEAEDENRQWEAIPDEIAYGLFVVRPA